MDLDHEVFLDRLDIHAQALKAALRSRILNTSIPSRDTDFYLNGVPRHSHRWQLIGGCSKSMRDKGRFWLAMHHAHQVQGHHRPYFIGTDGTIINKNAKFVFPLDQPDMTSLIEACRTAFTGCAAVYFTDRCGRAIVCRSCPHELLCSMENL